MTDEIKFNTIDELIAELKKMNISKVAFSEVKERRAEQTKDDLLEVVVVRKVDILSYRDSVIYKFSYAGEEVDAYYSILVENGFEVKRINKNIT